MTEPTLALQATILGALKGATDAGAAVFDVLTPNTFPRVQIGQGDAVPNDAQCIDGFDVTMQIDVWSKADGYREAKIIAGQIYGLLHKKPLTATGFNLIDIWLDGTVYSRDGEVSRARIMVGALMEKA